MTNFVHLHVHSEYSLLDGLPKIKNLVSRVKELGMDSVALTDHGVMYGAIEFYKECLYQEIKPIIGMEGYTVTGDHHQKQTKADRENNHLVLLARDFTGYQNLMKISTLASTEGYYYRPRLSKQMLPDLCKGLIALTACPKSEIGQHLLNDRYKEAKETAAWYQKIFGDDNFYLEIQRHQFNDYLKAGLNPKIKSNLELSAKQEQRWVEQIIRLSRELGIPLVATNDVHYLRQEDAHAQDVLVCVATGKNVEEIDRLRYIDTPTFYLRTPEEMATIFADYPDAISNTVKIANRINIEIELGKWNMPVFKIPQKQTPEDYLRSQVEEKKKIRYPQLTSEIAKRIDYELDVIIQKGYASYFLIMADLVNWCTGQGIATNTRGSAAGSCVSYVLGITIVDPILYALPFERFLNPFRPKPPDIDLDIADDRREDLLNYIVQKYGQEKVAQICTFGRMLARASIRDVGRVLGFPYSYPDKLAKLIPLGSQGFPMTIDHALEQSPDLKEIYDRETDAKQILNFARQIEGNARHASVHAAGVVVSPTLTTDYTPLQLEPKGTKVITQYEMHACEDVGLVKFDILGIRNLSILGAAIHIIEKERNVKIDLLNLPRDDKQTFTMLSRGDTMGVFQLGGSGMTRWLMELKPNRIEDIMVMIALFRPGPMANIPDFIARKNGKQAVAYLHPKMKNFLEKSYGILVYQEDILSTALEIAGYNWNTVDALRQAIGKKKPKEMAEQHDIFIDGCKNISGLTKNEAEKIWALFVPFQGYGFNKAHAASYGIVSYQTAYLKAHFPVEYMTALLTAESDDLDKIAQAINECRRMNIPVLPPDINCSETGFTIENNSIRFGLGAIKNVGETAIGIILQSRQTGGHFRSLSDLCLRVDNQKVNKKVLESLIKVGALDQFGSRAALLGGLEKIRAQTLQIQKQKNTGQANLFGDVSEDQPQIYDNLPVIEDFSRSERLSLERELLGLFLTENPLISVLEKINQIRTHQIVQLDQHQHQNQTVRVGGLLVGLRVVTTKNGNREMCFIKLEDDTGNIEVVVFPNTYIQNKVAIVKDTVVIIEGKIESRDEKLSLLAERVLSIEEAVQTMAQQPLAKANNIQLVVPFKTSPSKLMELNKILQKNKGNDQITLVFVNSQGQTKRLELPYRVNYSPKIKSLIDDLLNH